jgi:hypothetical protein
MKTILAIWKNGQIVPMESVDWPDGTTLSIEPVQEPEGSESEGDLLGSDPATIARWTASYDALPPMRMTEAEEAAWRDAQQDMRDYTIAKMRVLTIEDQS